METEFVSVFFWTGLTLIAAFLLADYAYRLYASRRIQGIIENVPTFAAIPTPPEPDLDVVNIQTPDRVDLQACVHRPKGKPRGVVVFCPELNGNHWTALHYGRALIDAGFVLLSFDFRKQGACSGQQGYLPIHWVTEFELSDIDGVLGYIRNSDELKTLPLGIFGISRGGSAALIAACRHPEIQSVATDSSYSTMSLIRHFMNKFSRFVVPDWFFRWLPRWHIELVLRQALARSQKQRSCRYIHLEQEAASLPANTQTLLISGSRDSYVTPQVSHDVAQTLKRPDAVCIIEKAKHNKSRSRAPQDYDRRLVEHFVRTLLEDDVSHSQPRSRVA